MSRNSSFLNTSCRLGPKCGSKPTTTILTTGRSRRSTCPDSPFVEPGEPGGFSRRALIRFPGPLPRVGADATSRASPSAGNPHQAPGAAPKHPPAEHACHLRSHVWKDDRKKCAREWVEEERREQERDRAFKPPLLRQLEAPTQTPDDPSRERKADREKDERASPMTRTQHVLPPDAQDDGGADPDSQAAKKESKIHNMNLSSDSYYITTAANAIQPGLAARPVSRPSRGGGSCSGPRAGARGGSRRPGRMSRGSD
jgi:hypothetical protein